MYPSVTHLQALLAALGTGDNIPHLTEMCTLHRCLVPPRASLSPLMMVYRPPGLGLALGKSPGRPPPPVSILCSHL